VVVDSEERARMLNQGRKKKQEKDRLRKIDEDMTEEAENADETPERVEMPIVVKADVQGSVQAVTDALRSLNSPQVFSQAHLIPYFYLFGLINLTTCTQAVPNC
jgi:translation initiation factor IF-2